MPAVSCGLCAGRVGARGVHRRRIVAGRVERVDARRSDHAACFAPAAGTGGPWGARRAGCAQARWAYGGAGTGTGAASAGCAAAVAAVVTIAAAVAAVFVVATVVAAALCAGQGAGAVAAAGLVARVHPCVRRVLQLYRRHFGSSTSEFKLPIRLDYDGMGREVCQLSPSPPRAS